MSSQGVVRQGSFDGHWGWNTLGLGVSIRLGEGNVGSFCYNGTIVRQGVPEGEAEQAAKEILLNMIGSIRDACDEALPEEPSEPVAFSKQRSSFSTLPPAWCKPVNFGLLKDSWKVRCWKDILVQICEYLAVNSPDKFQQAFDSDRFEGTKRRSLGRSSTESNMKMPAQVKIGGKFMGYVETSYSAEDAMTLSRDLLDFCGVDISTAWYEYIPVQRKL